MAGEAFAHPTGFNPVDQVKPAENIDEETVESLRIDPEFMGLNPPLDPVEKEELKRSLLKEGCRDKLAICRLDGEYVLLDGHNRYGICQELGIPFETTKIDISNRIEAKIWILKNQMARRNLNESQRAMLAVALMDLYAEDAKLRQGTRTDMGKNLDQSKAGRSAKKAGDDMGISPQTVIFAGKVAKKGIPELAGLVNSGKVAVSAAAKATSLPPDTQRIVVEKVEEKILKGKRADIAAIIREIAPKTPESDAQEHIKKFSKNLDACLKLLGGIQASPSAENLAEMQTKVQEILAKLKEIESLDPAKQNSSLGSENPQTADQNQSMEELQAKGELPEVNSEPSNASDNNEDVEDEDEDEPDSDQDCQDYGYSYPSDPVEDSMGDPYGYEESDEEFGYDAVMNDI